MNILTARVVLIRGFCAGRASLAVENLALRQQLAILKRSVSRPKLRRRDRFFWALLSRLWLGWRSALILVSPDTVVRWHRLGFRLFWRWKSRSQPGRPALARVVQQLIRRLSQDNPLWGAPRIQAELRLLGHDVAKSTVAKYMIHSPKPPSQNWRSFLKNHVGSLASMDFFVAPTITFQLLYVFVILRHDRRQVVHCNVTTQPTAAWVAQQLREAFPFDTAPRYLIRDRDGCYGEEVKQCLKALGIEEVVTAPRSPWQNPFAERLIGTLRRDCLDHVIVLGEVHLRRILQAFLVYYHEARCHQSLEGNAPQARAVEPPERGKVVAEPMVGGLHHRYRRVA
jgi:transposase InsO family protein